MAIESECKICQGKKFKISASSYDEPTGYGDHVSFVRITVRCATEGCRSKKTRTVVAARGGANAEEKSF